MRKWFTILIYFKIHPNPFNPNTKISYSLHEKGFVTLKIVDLLGKEVASLVNEVKGAGFYEVNFEAAQLPSGIYFYSINVNNFHQTKKMLIYLN